MYIYISWYIAEDFNSSIPGFHLSLGRFLKAPRICEMVVDMASGLPIHDGGRSRVYSRSRAMKVSKIFLQSSFWDKLRWTCCHSTLVAECGVSDEVNAGLKIWVWVGNPPRKVDNSTRALTALVAFIGEAVKPRNLGLLFRGKSLICKIWRAIVKMMNEKRVLAIQGRIIISKEKSQCLTLNT